MTPATFVKGAARTLNRALRPAGYMVTRVTQPCLDLSDATDDLIEAAYIAGHRVFIIRVSIEKCRGLSFNAFPLCKTSKHPFVATCVRYAETPSTLPRNSPLNQFYEEFQPKNALERLGLPKHLWTGPLAYLPADAVPDPWTSVSPEQAARNIRIWAERENKREGEEAPADQTGYNDYGPLSKTKLDIEHRRLFRIRDSVRVRGYQLDANASPLSAHALLNGNKIAFHISGGQHRLAALAALNYKSVPLQISRLVRGEDIPYWPNVKSGLYSPEQARHVFDRMMAGKQPIEIGSYTDG